MTIRISPLAAAGLLALGAIDAWLAAIVAGDIGASDQAATAQVSSTLKLPPSTDRTPSAKPLDAYKQILAHPIFYRSREPFVPPPPVVPKPIAPPPPPAPVYTDPAMVVAGIMIGRGIRKAYVFNKADPHGSWVSQGETVGGWTLQAIDRTSIKLQQRDRIIELQLYPSTDQAGAGTRNK